MRYLIDSHALIWWWNHDKALSEVARRTLADRSNAIYVSAASAWELVTKFRSGRLPAMARHIGSFDASVVSEGFYHLDIRHDHGIRGAMLEGAHKDPFDRLIAAQALIEDLIVITRDREIAAFGCKVLW